MGAILPFIALGCSLAGGYLAGFLVFRKVFKQNVPHLKLIGFLATFLVVSIGLLVAIGSLVSSNVPFGR